MTQNTARIGFQSSWTFSFLMCSVVYLSERALKPQRQFLIDFFAFQDKHP